MLCKGIHTVCPLTKEREKTAFPREMLFFPALINPTVERNPICMKAFQISPCGDSALSIEFRNEISEEVHEQVASMTTLLESAGLTGVRELIPTYRAIMVCYDPFATDFELLASKIERLARRAHKTTIAHEIRRVTIPVCYGGDFGPDLQNVAHFHGISTDEVIELHAAPTYLIYMLGFTPGFSYLGGMDRRIATPRLDNPRTLIPGGSVGIAGAQTGIYPIDSPGGWQLIGRTPLDLYRPDREPPVLLRAGYRITFRPIDRAEYDCIRAQVERDAYTLEEEVIG